MRKALIFALVIFLLVPMFAFADDDDQVVGEVVFLLPQANSNVQIISVKTDIMSDWAIGEENIREWLATEAFSGKYNVLSVKTVYHHGFLFSAEVQYDASREGYGNTLRVKFPPLSMKGNGESVRGWVQEIVKEVNVAKVQTVYCHGVLYTAEIYYTERE